MTPTAPPTAPKKSRTANFNPGHLDPHRARKLKKQWLETQKIKAAYRAQKHRMGLGKVQASPDSGKVGDDAEEDDIAGGDAEDEERPVRSNDRSLVEADPSPPSRMIATARTHDEGRPRRTSSGTNEGTAVAESQQPIPSLREMAREAYSPASLHTYKSHSLGRRAHGKSNARIQANDLNHARGGGKRGAPGKRGRGQPNMAKRMGLLLEKIKRTGQ